MQDKSNDSSISTNEEGFLLDKNKWNPTIALQLAARENIQLNEDHWTVIYSLRDFYHHYEMEPALRILIKKLSENWGKRKSKQSIFV